MIFLSEITQLILLSTHLSFQLQSVCADIFLPHHATPGLLRNPPADISPQIDNLLAQCYKPGPAEQVQRSSQTNTFISLEAALRKSVAKELKMVL